VKVRFLTPCRLTREGRLQDTPAFSLLIRSLLRRLSTLTYFHHGVEPDFDLAGLIAAAEEVKLVEDKTTWVDWERYSSRQDARMKLGGFVGEAVYEADPAAWEVLFPLLRLAEHTHVGKNTAFGLGWVKAEVQSAHRPALAGR
jgi:CRISPR-associated endoribonuclease Cas6